MRLYPARMNARIDVLIAVRLSRNTGDARCLAAPIAASGGERPGQVCCIPWVSARLRSRNTSSYARTQFGAAAPRSSDVGWAFEER